MVDEVAKATWAIVSLEPHSPDQDALTVAWPTKLREYLAVGRPVLCIANESSAAAEITRAGGWGIVASTPEQTRQALQTAVSGSHEALVRSAAAAHAFALERLDNKTVGARWRARALA